MYESKRVDGRVVTSYLGSPTQKFKRRIAYAFLFALLLGVLAFFVISYLHGASTTGRVAFDVNVVYKEGEPLDGDLKFRIKEGELVPSNAELLISYGDQSKTVPLSDLIHDATISGNYYAEGTSLGGDGDGYGAPGIKLEYPTLTFDLLVYSGDGFDVSEGPGDSGAGQGSDEEVVDGGESAGEEAVEGDNGVAIEETDGSNIEESGSENGGSSEGSTESEGGASGDSSNSGDSGSDGGDSGDGGGDGGPSISGAFVSESEFTVPGEVSHKQGFDYTLSSGQHARIVPDSVRVNGEVVPDSTLSISTEGDEVRVSTDYFISEEGFGEEFLGDYALTLEVDIEQLGLTALPGDLGLTLMANDVVVASYKQDVQVAQLPAENNTVPIITQVADLPLLRIGTGESGQIDLGDYFSGAESFDAAIDNMTVSFDGDIITITPQEGFKGSRKAHVVARAGNEQLVSNDFTILVSSGAVRITTERDRIVVGEPVRWEKTVVLENAEPLNVELPEDAEHITIKKLEGGEYVEVTRGTGDGDAENSPITGGVLTGDVVIEVDLKKESFFKRIYKKIVYAITGNVVEGEEPAVDTGQDLVLNEGATEYVVEYYTPAPLALEKDTVEGKQIIISAADELHYSDVIASSELPNEQGLRSADSLALYWHVPIAELPGVDLKEVTDVPDSAVIEEEVQDETAGNNLSGDENFSSSVSGNAVNEEESMADYVRVAVPFDAYDLDEDGFIDYVEWVVPHLSNQTYDIVYITDAQHLDANRTVISDITGAVKNLDGVWSESIGDGDYVRVRYEINLTSSRDITVYPRTVNGTPRINIYTRNGSTLINSFDSLVDNRYNKAFLTGLQGEEDTFDLHIIGGSVEFDQIVDPSDVTAPNISFVGVTPADLSTQSSRTISVNVSSNDDGAEHYTLADFDRSLALWLRMDETNSSGGVLDSSSWSLNGTPQSGAAKNASGHYNASFQFDGTDDRISLPNAPNLNFGTNSFTFSAWIKTNLTSGTAERIFNKRSGSLGYEFYIESGQNILSFLIGDATGVAFGSGNQGTGNYTLRNNQWHHIVVVVNRSNNGTFYVDGFQRGALSVAHRNQTLDNSVVAYVGMFGAGGSNFNGQIDDLILFNRSLSYAEVRALYNATLDPYFASFTNLSSGSHTFRAYAVDLANNVNSTSSRTVTVDLTGPTVLLLHPTNGSTVTNPLVYFGVNVTDNFNVTNATLSIWNATSLVGTNTSIVGVANAIVNLSFTLPRYDTYFWNYLASDAAGNSTFNATNYTLSYVSGDTTPPLVTINLPANITYTTLPLNFNVTLNEDGSSVLYTLNGGVTNYTMTTLNNRAYNATNSSLADGSYTFRVYANDSAGNRNDTVSVSFTFENTNITSCTILDRAGTAYVQGANLIPSGSIASCINITAQNISFNGAGYWITNTTFVGDGIYSNQFNTTILGTNVTVTASSSNWAGLHLQQANGSYVYNNIFNSQRHGLFIDVTSNCLVENNTLSSNVDSGVRIASGSTNNTLRFNIANSNTRGINFVSGTNIAINNTFSSNSIGVLTSTQTYLYNNTISSSTSAGISSTGFNSLFMGNVLNLNFDSIIISSANNNTVYLGSINGSRKSAIVFSGTASSNFNNFITDVSITSTNSSGYDVNFSVASVNKTMFSNVIVNNYTFSGVGGTIYVNKSGLAFVSFLVPVNGSGTNMSGNVVLGNNSVVIGAGANGGFNRSANITLYSVLTNFSTPAIIKDGVACTSCYNYTSLNAGTVVFNVTGAGTYSIGEKPDSVAPTVDFASPTEANNSYLARTYILVNTTASDSNLQSIVTRLYNSGGQINFSTSSTSPLYLNFSGLSDGMYYFNSTANDSVGNTNFTDTRTVVLDATYPLLEFSIMPDNGSTITDSFTTFKVNLEDTNPANISFFLYNSTGLFYSETTTDTSLSIDPLSGLSDGTYYFNATGRDLANSLNTTATYTFTVDSVAPIVTINSPTGNLSAAQATFNVTTNENAGAALFTLNSGVINVTMQKNGNRDFNYTNSSIADGTYTVRFYVNDSAGNTNSSAIRTFMVDTHAPNFTIYSPTNITYSATNITINFTSSDALAGVSARWFYNGTGNTSYTGVVYQIVGQGSNTFIFYSNDTLGNLNSTSVTFTVDNGAPTIDYANPTEVNGTYVSRTYVLVNVTAVDTNLQSIVTRLYNASNTQVNTGSSSTSSLYTNFSGLADGRYTFNSTANDTLGNTNRTQTRTVFVDTTRPLVSLTGPTPADNTVTRVNTPSIEVTVTDTNFANFTYSLYNSTGLRDSQVSAVAQVAFPYDFDPLADGVYTYNATAYDLAGNVNSSATRILTIDTHAPNFTVFSPLNTTYGINNITINFTSSDALAGVSARWFYNGTGNTSYTGVVYQLVASGSNTFIFYSNDSAGNTNSTSVTFATDNSAPAVDFASPTEANNSYLARTYILVNTTASDSNLQSIVTRLYNSGGQINFSTSSTSPLYLNFSGLSDGMYYFNSTANDSVGNTNFTSTRIVTVDSVVPLINFYAGTPANGSVTANTTITFSVNASDINLQVINLYLYNTTGLYTFQNLSTSPLAIMVGDVPPGVYTFNATAIDLAGNINRTETRTFTVDSTVPALTITYPQNTSYAQIVTVLNYTVSDATNLSCTYSTDGGETNNTIACGTNVTVTSVQGSNVWSISASDAAANQNVSSVTFFVDSLKPSIAFTTGTPASGSYTRANLSVNVTATDVNLANITIRLYNSSQTLISTNVSTTSPYALTYTGLSDGTYIFNATATDGVSNVNHTESRSIIVDSVAPTITTIVSPDEQRSYSGSTIDFIIQLNEEVSFCNYTLNGGVTNYTMISGPDEFYATNSTMADGGYIAYFYCWDYADNFASSNVEFAVDNVAPIITVNSPNTNVTVSQVTFNVTVSETSNGVQSRFTLNDGVTNYSMTRTTPGNFNYTNYSIADGTYTVRFYVNDSAGNLNSSVTRTFIVDTIKPNINVTSPVNTTYPTTNITINFTSSDANGISARWFYNGTGNTTYTGVSSMIASQGSHTFVFYSNDSLGNFNSTSVTYSVNSVSPTIDYVSPTESNNTYLSRSYILVNVTANDQDLQTITNRLYNASVALVNSSTSSSSSLYSNFSGLSDGMYYFNSIANDSTGNTNTTPTRTVVIDRTAPNLTFGGSTPSNGSIRTNLTVSIQLAASDVNLANITLRIYNATTLIQTEFTSESPIVLQGDFADGAYIINGSATDLANNVGYSETRTFAIDATVPNVTFVSPTPSNNSYTNSTIVTINVTGYETSRSSVFASLNGTNYTMTCTGTSAFVCNYTFSGLSLGIYTLRAYVNDTAGNLNSTELRMFTIDSLRPGITYGYGTENTNETISNLTIYLNLSISESNMANITFSLYNTTSLYNRTTFSAGIYTMNWTNVPAGVYRYEANVTDLANNRNGTILRTVNTVTTCLGFCSEGSACSLTNRQCYLSSDMCSGGVCDFVNFTMQNSTVYSLYNASSDGNNLLINISSNSSTSVRFLQNATFIFGGKNGTSISGGSRGGHAGIVNITTVGLFNRTQSRFIGLGGYSTVNGAGGNGGMLQINYHGLIGVSSGWTTSFRAGNSTNSTVGSAGTSLTVKDSACPLDPDGTNNGVVDGTDADTIQQLYYGNLSTDDTFNSSFDFNCDGVINVQDISRIGFNYLRR